MNGAIALAPKLAIVGLALAIALGLRAVEWYANVRARRRTAAAIARVISD